MFPYPLPLNKFVQPPYPLCLRNMWVMLFTEIFVPNYSMQGMFVPHSFGYKNVSPITLCEKYLFAPSLCMKCFPPEEQTNWKLTFNERHHQMYIAQYFWFLVLYFKHNQAKSNYSVLRVIKLKQKISHSALTWILNTNCALMRYRMVYIIKFIN